MKLIVVQCAALGRDLWERLHKGALWSRLSSTAIRPTFPALTCVAQASFRTASEPRSHGVVANGFFDRDLRKASFWEQSSRLVQGKRIWEDFRSRGKSVGLICWQQSLGLDADVILSPGPVHKHHGGMIQAWHSKPADLYEKLAGTLRKKFDLKSYWGPFASIKSTEWITSMVVELIAGNAAPELLLTYLPHLDYALQRSGPDCPEAVKAFLELEERLGRLSEAAATAGYEMVVFGDYAITRADAVMYPNMVLRDAGLLSTREINGMLYPDLYSSRAFAMVDHQVAHVYASDKESAAKARAALEEADGLEAVLAKDALPHERSGDLILVAKPGWWLAYPWWRTASQAPDYARHVDIHNKPGFDPCELFLGLWPPFSVSLDARRIKGTHGRSSGTPEEMAFLGSTIPELTKASSVEELARLVQRTLI